MSKKKFKNEKSLASIDEVFKFTDEVLKTETVVMKASKTIPPLVGLYVSGSAAAGIAGAMGLGTGTVGVGTAAFTGGAAVGGTFLLPILLPASIVGGLGYLIFKNKKEKELHKQKLARYNEAIKKQNEVIKKYEQMESQRKQSEQKLKEENRSLREKMAELRIINDALVNIINDLQSDLKIA